MKKLLEEAKEQQWDSIDCDNGLQHLGEALALCYLTVSSEFTFKAI